MTKCPNCESLNLSVSIDKILNIAAPGHGMLSMNDVRPVVVIGCEECSETVEILEVDDPRIRLTVIER